MNRWRIFAATRHFQGQPFASARQSLTLSVLRAATRALCLSLFSSLWLSCTLSHTSRAGSHASVETEKWIRNTTHVTEEKYTVHMNVYDFLDEKDKCRYGRRRKVFSGDSCTLYWRTDRISAGYSWKHVHLVLPSLASAAGREWHVLIKKICCIKARSSPIWPR